MCFWATLQCKYSPRALEEVRGVSWESPTPSATCPVTPLPLPRGATVRAGGFVAAIER